MLIIFTLFGFLFFSFLKMQMQQKLYLPVLNNLEYLFKSKKNYDVIIQAGEGNNQKEIYAHSLILCCQSTYFDTALSTNWAEKKDGSIFLRQIFHQIVLKL